MWGWAKRETMKREGTRESGWRDNLREDRMGQEGCLIRSLGSTLGKREVGISVKDTGFNDTEGVVREDNFEDSWGIVGERNFDGEDSILVEGRWGGRQI
ncbi:hypothetical protein ACLOJK_028316 [Asimina triloba]